MSLKHVVLLTNDGWRYVEPSYIHDNYSSAESGKLQLYCELCKERADAVCWGKIQAPHFRHNKSAKTKECEDRNAVYERSDWLKNPRKREFFIRVRFAESGELASFELLAPCPPRSFIDANRGAAITLSWENASGSQERTHYITSLFSPISIGIVYRRRGCKSENPGASYVVGLKGGQTSGAEVELRRYWGLGKSDAIPGIASEEHYYWFDAKIGLKLPRDADVYVGREYWLWTTCDEPRPWGTALTLEPWASGGFYINSRYFRVYKVCANKIDQEASLFFGKRGVRLTNNPAKIVAVWPPCAIDGAVVKTSDRAESVFFYFQGEGRIKARAYPLCGSVNRELANDERCGLLKIGKEDVRKVEIVSVGRSNALHYAMIWRDRLNFTAEAPTVEIVDADDWATRFDGEVARTLSQRQEVRVKFRFDGVLEIWRKGALAERRELKAKKRSDGVASTVVKRVDWETTLKIWIGKDCVRTLRFERENAAGAADALSDRDLARALRSKRGGGTLGFSRTHAAALAARLGGEYPATKTWLRQAAQVGEISQDALAVLKDVGKNAQVGINERQRKINNGNF